MAENKPQYSGILVVLITICVATAVAFMYANGMLERAELFTLDHRFSAAHMSSAPFLQQFKLPKSATTEEGPQKKAPYESKKECDVILIDIPESGKEGVSGPNLKDCVIAAKILTIWGAKAIVFADLLPDKTQTADDAELIEVANSSKGVYLPVFYDTWIEGGDRKYIGSPAASVKGPWQELSMASVGHINAFPYTDGRLRQVPVFIEYNGTRTYQLGIKVAMDIMGMTDKDVKFDPVKHVFIMEIPSGWRITVPLENDNQLDIKWKTNDGLGLKRMSFRDILESYRLTQYDARPIIDPNMFSGNVCILGTAASNNISARPPIIGERRATSAACGLIIRSILKEDFIHGLPKIPAIALIMIVIFIFGTALANFQFLRLMMIVVVAISLFSLASMLHMPQDIAMIAVIVLAVPLGIFIASSQVFSGLIFATLSIVGYYLIAAGLFNTTGLVIPVFFPILGMAATFGLFYTYARFKDYIGNMRLFNLASKDGLTGLTNRRYLNMLLDAELNSATLDKSRKLSIVMCDIDNFKKLNDTHGHQAGDAILKRFAKIMRSKCRQWDIVARYGGEEFIIIFPGAAAKDAMVAAENIRQAIAEEKFVFKGNPYSTSMSMGLAEYSNERTKEEFIEKADQALYRAKSEGKNRVCR